MLAAEVSLLLFAAEVSLLLLLEVPPPQPVNKNILEQRKKLVERKERSHRLIVKGAEFEKAFPLSRDLEQEDVQDVMDQLQNSSCNKSIVRQVHIAALHKEQQQIAEAVEKAERGDGS